MAASEAGVLQRMFETGEFSDLTIGTSTKTFKVHKAVVCQKSPFFRAACTRDFLEAKTGHINLEENESVIYASLQHLYELQIDMKIVKPLQDDQVLRREFVELVRLSVAADKVSTKARTPPRSEHKSPYSV
ncbi:hypothetical protein LTR37_018339 [Vermiconidia calcicola]|uniref:Uncharacterized protein n=1 Tax=Vermiconidia calcicola TaxID=1690605 RepID=A0ACC3MK33_9PEZI|nr:hypothetical protein LTR37_018339 [Vermiconidia calcicola]